MDEGRAVALTSFFPQFARAGMEGYLALWLLGSLCWSMLPLRGECFPHLERAATSLSGDLL